MNNNSTECTCGNPEMGFPCVCAWVKKFPGDISYGCGHCGLYTAGAPRCNKCEVLDPEPPTLNSVLDDLIDAVDRAAIKDAYAPQLKVCPFCHGVEIPNNPCGVCGGTGTIDE